MDESKILKKLFCKLKELYCNSNILKTGIMSLIGTFMIKAVNLVSIPVFSRMLSLEDYGKTNIFMTYVSVFSIILGLDFVGAVGRGCLEFKDDKNRFMSVGVSITLIFTIFIIGVSNLFQHVFCRLLSVDVMQLNILLVYSYASFVVSFVSAEFVFYYKYKLNTLLGVTVAIGNFTLSVILIKTKYQYSRYTGRILGAAIPTIIIALIVLVYLLYRGKLFLNKCYALYFIKIGIPLIPHNLSHIILGHSDKIMIDTMIGSGENGIYSLVYNVGWMLSVLTEALNNVWSPWMFRELEKNNIKVIRKAFNLYMAGFTIVTIALETISPELVMLIAPPKYWEGIHIVNWMVFSVYLSFMYTLYVNIEFYEKRTPFISVGTVLAAIINIVLNIIFLKNYGYNFAAISTVISYFVLVIFHMFIVMFVIKKNIINWKNFLILIGFMFVYSIFMQTTLESFLIRAGILIVGVAIISVMMLKWKNETIQEIKRGVKNG